MNDNPGCPIAIVMVLFIAVVIIGGMVAYNNIQDSATTYEVARGNAESAIERARGQAAIDRAQAERERAEAEAEVTRAQAEAEAKRIAAQGQARLDSAQAAIITTAANTQATIAKMQAGLPWAILGVLGILGLAIVALAFTVVARSVTSPPPQQIVERQIFLLPPNERAYKVLVSHAGRQDPKESADYISLDGNQYKVK